MKIHIFFAGVLAAAMACLVLPFAGAQSPSWKPVASGLAGGAVRMLYAGACDFSATAFADIDGDGDLDLFVGQAEGFPMFLRNDGTPRAPHWTFIAQNITLPTLSSSPRRAIPAFADVDGDGVLDLLLGLSNGAVAYYHNDGTKTQAQWRLVSENWTAPIHIIANGINARPALVDIDGDGLLDLFVGHENTADHNGYIAFFRNIGDAHNPQWEWVQDNFRNIHVNGAASLFFCDIDGDGDYDLFVGDAAGHVHFYRNYGNAQFAAFIEESDNYCGLEAGKSAAPTLADLRCDGVSDLFVGSMAGGIIHLKNTGIIETPQWSAPEPLWLGLDAGLNSAVEVADIDGDGVVDLFLAAQNNATTGGYGIQHYHNAGAPWLPNWELKDLQFAGLAIDGAAPRFVDIDGDGDLDLFLGTMDQGMRFFRNSGSAHAPVLAEETTGAITVSDGYLCRPALADMNGDGLLDLWIAFCDSFTVPYLYYYRNTGDSGHPIWAAPEDWSAILPGGTLPSVAAGDVDGDGLIDLVIGMDSGEVYFFRCIQSTPTLQFSAPEVIPSVSPETFPSPALADLDGDGWPDLLVGGAYGGVRCYQNPFGERPAIRPPHATVASSASIAFATSGALSGSWEIRSNGSGAIINPLTGAYTAGSASGVDVIQFRQSQTTWSLAYVNVLQPAQMTAAGKAVIMAGRSGGGDTLWPTTNRLANSVYQALLDRGFAKDNIYYLNPDPAQDTDGNGLNDDIQGPSSLANIQTALTGWAHGASSLFIYLIDHGAEPNSDAYIRCNETDVLYASQLNQWLNDLQDAGTTTITLVVDCCQSGAFLDKCHATSSQCRVVIGSAGDKEPAFFSAGGLISFTSAFVNDLYLGRSVGEAFQTAADGMERYQHAQLDDDGNAVYEPGRDGTLARSITLGGLDIAGADRPRIGWIVENQTLTTSSASATVWASEIISPYPIDRVWACLVPPRLGPDSQTQADQPVLEIPELELLWNEAASRYEATTASFAQFGAHRAVIYARDSWGGVSFPKQSYVNQRLGKDKMVIVCGDGAYDSDSPHGASAYVANSAYAAARTRWMTNEDIAYLVSSPEPSADALPTKANLAAAIAASAGADQLIVFLIGRGNAAAFDINGNGPDGGDVAPGELCGWLDDLQTSAGAKVIVVLDFVYSGDWVTSLAAPLGCQRIVIASCGLGQVSYCKEGGVVSFSQYLFNKAREGVNIREAFSWARTAMLAATLQTQHALLDDDGDGRATKRDGAVAASAYLGAAYAPEVEKPIISDCAPSIVLTSDSAVLWASGVWAHGGIERVYAKVASSDAASSRVQYDEIELLYTSATARWEGAVLSLDPTQRYTVVYFAQDRARLLSEPVAASMGPPVPESEDFYDRYCSDDTTQTLNLLANANTQQEHNLYPWGDADWVAFNVIANHFYTIQVTSQGLGCDAIIRLYLDSDLTSPAAVMDERGAGESPEILTWYSDSYHGAVFVEIAQSPDLTEPNGEATSYTLLISGDWGSNAGLPTIATGIGYISTPDGGTVRAGSVSPSAPQQPAYFNHELLIPPNAVNAFCMMLIMAPDDMGPEPIPQTAYTKAWLLAHPQNASIARFVTCAPDPIVLNTTASLTIEFLPDNHTYSDFAIKDLPDGAKAEDMRIYYWNGASWVILPGPQIVSVSNNWVTGEITSLGALDYDGPNSPNPSMRMSLYAVAPAGTTPATSSPTPSPTPVHSPTPSASPTPVHSPTPSPTRIPSPTPSPTAVSRTYTGLVVDDVSSLPIAQAHVLAEGLTSDSCVTTGSGEYSVTILVNEASTFTLTASRDGYTTRTDVYPALQSSPVNLSLHRIASPTPSPTATPNLTSTPNPTVTPSPTPSATPAHSPTPTPTPTPTHVPSPTPPHSPTPSPTRMPSPSPTPTAVSKTYSGLVVDDVTSLPIAQAHVLAEGLTSDSCVTTAPGEYGVTILVNEASTFTLIAWKDGYTTTTDTYPALQSSPVNLSLHRIASPTPCPTATPNLTSTPSPTAAPSPTPNPTPAHSPTPTRIPSPTPPNSPTPRPTHVPSPTPPHSPSPSPTRLPSPSPSPTAVSKTYTGFVFDDITSLPIAQAHVFAQGLTSDSCVTTDSGEYGVTILVNEASTFTLIAWRDGYTTRT
ncbi:MAG: FG-GAP-like repeat-containing protein, partial [Candidatus Sumerlaeota bacterium]|nr:FG-GAP-like repeat-containing protein [Candidatus Sumerlaeota bacterium]